VFGPCSVLDGIIVCLQYLEPACLLPNGLGGAFQLLQGGVVSTDQKVGPEQILSELFYESYEC